MSERKLPHDLNIHEMKALLDVRKSLRDQAIFEVLYAGGLRVSEVIGLETRYLNLEVGMMLVMGKGRKERYVPLRDKSVEACKKYAEEKKKLGFQTVTFFVSRRGVRLSRQSVWQIVKKYALMTNIVKPVYPHVFRHTFATEMLDNGANIRVVQELLGHSDISTTQIYTHVSRAKLKQVHNEFHPR